MKSENPLSPLAARCWPLILHTRVVSQTGGGPDKTILNSPRFLAELGYDCVCVYFRDPRDEGFRAIEQRALEARAPLIAVDDRGPFDYRLLSRLRSVLATFGDRPIIWHGHDYKSNLAGLLLQRHRPMPIVTTVHGWGVKNWKTPLYYAIDRWCLKRCEQVICVSEDLLGDCQRLGVPQNRLHLIHNAIDLEASRRTLTVAEAKAAIGWASNRWLIGAVGRLEEEKGFDVLLAAAAELVARGMDVGVVIVGTGSQHDLLEQLAIRLGIADRVTFAGFVADPKLYYQAMDVFVLSSRREGLPNVLLEAMALQVPVVATEVGGVGGILEHGVNGSLIPSNEVPALVTAIHQTLSDAEARNQCVKAGRITVEQKYSFAERMRKIVGVYERVARGE